ncbi:hypothetical protein AGMMS49991_01870 [Spirochaetia bacterium]|nr:hypothetical protein AGMMS49991_01870 [Spirochaetia bacterium]
MGVQYVVKTPKSLGKTIRNMPDNAVKALRLLIDDIKESGPIQSGYPNYSKLGKVTYHCHLAYSWVACWRCEKGEYIVEVEYVGSREKAPY